jgi:pilus assembly protein Flp/PilA
MDKVQDLTHKDARRDQPARQVRGAANMNALLARFAADQSGATAIEYGLIGTLVSVAIIVGALALGTQLNVMFQDVADTVADPTS